MIPQSEKDKQKDEQFEQALFRQTEKAIKSDPENIVRIRQWLDRILLTSVDIDEYYDMACDLSDCLKITGKGTLFFEYFYEHIDPNQNGQACFLRAICKDLKDRITDFDHWRKKNHQIICIK